MIIGVAIWLISGIIGYGFFTGSSKKQFPYFEPFRPIQVASFLTGPVGILATFLTYYHLAPCAETNYGFSFTNYTTEERYAKFVKRFGYAYLTFEEFVKEY